MLRRGSALRRESVTTGICRQITAYRKLGPDGNSEPRKEELIDKTGRGPDGWRSWPN